MCFCCQRVDCSRYNIKNSSPTESTKGLIQTLMWPPSLYLSTEVPVLHPCCCPLKETWKKEGSEIGIGGCASGWQLQRPEESKRYCFSSFPAVVTAAALADSSTLQWFDQVRGSVPTPGCMVKCLNKRKMLDPSLLLMGVWILMSTGLSRAVQWLNRSNTFQLC